MYGTPLLACILYTHILNFAICSERGFTPGNEVEAINQSERVCHVSFSFGIRAASREVWGNVLFPEKCSGYAVIFNGLGDVGIRLRINIYLHNCVGLRWTQDMYCCTFFSPLTFPHLNHFFFLRSDMAEHWVTVFHLIKSRGWPAQMLCGLHLEGVLTFSE